MDLNLQNKVWWNYIEEDFKELKEGIKNKEITPELLLDKFKIFNSNLK